MLHYAALAADRIASHFDRVTKLGLVVEMIIACVLAYSAGFLVSSWLHG